ncbi:MAG: HAMP domain-containing protein [Candidatus Omnitrophica bacterium]|nr:HAMP domain-containing protein [Candidatus Omnitrophota bacterium]
MKEHTAQSELPTPRRTSARVLRVWLVGLVIFGYLPAFTYGWLVWLLNEHQWFWTYLMYFTLVPVLGGLCLLLLPWLWYRPIRRALARWSSGGPVTAAECQAVYERALRLPLQVALASLAAAAAGYVLGTGVVHWRTAQPWIEVFKTIPAIPLVGGLMGAFCYFGTARALHPVVSWCSRQLPRPRADRLVPLGVKFLAVASVLVVATLCLLQPSAYTLGQTITEAQLKERAMGWLRYAVYLVSSAQDPAERQRALQESVIGKHGYAFVTDEVGRIIGPHPSGYTWLEQEHFHGAALHFSSQESAWVERTGQHRIVAFIRSPQEGLTYLSVVFPSDFAVPLRHYVQFSWIAILEVLCVLVLFGRYFAKSITTPLDELTRSAERIAQGDLSQRVPVSTDDELGEVARSFNRMVEELQASKANLEDYTRRLERSTQELSQLNQEMEDVLHVVSHDLRAPLINIQGFSKRLEPLMQQTLQALDRLAAAHPENGLQAEVAALKSAVRDRFTESLGFISKGVEKMDTLLASLLAISRVGRKADPIQPNDLNAILDDVLATLDHQLKDQAITVVRQPLPTGVPCRRNEVNQVFSNLVSNAIRYMGATGHRFIEIGGGEREDAVECFVRDTGVGIAPKDQERVFHMFTRLETVDAPGEGIGLAYVKKILRSHGGRIWVESQRGQGSTFRFTLPRAQVPAGG